jgi:hypothetical protein
MDKTFGIIGSVVGVIGILICLGAGVVRVTGGHWLFGFEAFTLFLGGIGVMMMACLLQVQAISLKLNQRS